MIVLRLRHISAALACSAFVSLGCGSPASDTSSPQASGAEATTALRTADEVARLPALTPELQRLLTTIRAADKGQLAISEEDGRFLRLMVVLNHTKKAIEIGGASGYSAIWLGLGLRETGGRLTTIEYDPVRAQELKANIAAARLGDVVTVVAGDAFKAVPAEPGTFDFVFIDAWKPDYQKYFDMTFPRVRRGGLILAHNVINKGADMQDFLKTVTTRADLLTAIVAPGSEGVSISVKR
ncbi:Putative O-methyltransferase [Luteitalea pratensis]|uniref:O-methyltransferase n=1 Tax=Luteitalea pratensis TaxID=1855912 RepID=A0A143PS42_LUTPR|nr:O-methyltransferase [Luteitalea pratensis]AMY10634.1 Putative O-methyltransferase [Luteitalea pratensis]